MQRVSGKRQRSGRSWHRTKRDWEEGAGGLLQGQQKQSPATWVVERSSATTGFGRYTAACFARVGRSLATLSTGTLKTTTGTSSPHRLSSSLKLDQGQLHAPAHSLTGLIQALQLRLPCSSRYAISRHSLALVVPVAGLCPPTSIFETNNLVLSRAPRFTSGTAHLGMKTMARDCPDRRQVIS